jgi:hypothetical protein
MMCLDKTKSYCSVVQKAGAVDGKVDSINYYSLFDDMGPIIAREIFKRRLNKHIMAEMDIKGM